jgi:hypothetical protein
MWSRNLGENQQLDALIKSTMRSPLLRRDRATPPSLELSELSGIAFIG